MIIGDLIFQFFSFAFIALIVLLLVWFFRTNNKTKDRIKNLEGKIDTLSEQIKKGNDNRL
ncbi:DUF4083 domain-containing protein [Metabacillus sp. FJAT-52054]|uniref:DUF4083 domain-containing protein n=1 Tax=Metabacillus sediminis TaxID=3117746 RepID=A0ABZ2NKD2_9BACI